jgi:hypothetical protein
VHPVTTSLPDVAGVRPRAFGTGTARHRVVLRNILAYLDAQTLGQHEVFIQYTAERFAEDGM